MKKSNRQVHETKGSFYNYLPKSWIKTQDITKNQELSLIEFFNGSIFIKSTQKRDFNEFVEQEVTSPLSQIGENISLLKSYILAAYIIGAEQITIIADDNSKINASKREEVINQIRLLSGFEIVKESNTLIQTREIGKVSDISSIIQTLFSTTLIMIRSLLEITVDNEDEKHLELEKELSAIISRDEDVNRYRYIVDRQTHLVLSNPSLGVELKLNPVSTFHYSNIAQNIERIGDHVSELALLLKRKMKKYVKIFFSYADLFQEILNCYEKLSEIYKQGNYRQTFDLLERLKEMEVKIKDKLESSGSSKSLILYHFGRILGYSINIAEITIDQIAFDELFEDNDVNSNQYSQ